MPVQPVLYEAMYILDAKLDEEGAQTAVQTLEDFVTSNGGEVIATREFGKRRLAFEIEGHTSGTYMILYFKSFGPLVAEVQHEMRLIDAIVRGIICVANPKAIFDPTPEVVEEAPAEEAAAEEAEEAVAETEEAPAEAEEAVAETEEAPAEAEEAVAEAEEAPAEAEEAVAAAEEAPAEVEEAVAEEAPAEEAVVAEAGAEAPTAIDEPAVEEEAPVAEAEASEAKAPAAEEEA